MTPANLRNFLHTERDEPGQISQDQENPNLSLPKTPARTQSFDATVAARWTSSDVGVGRRPFVKSTVIQQTEGLGCGEMIERWAKGRAAESRELSDSARS